MSLFVSSSSSLSHQGNGATSHRIFTPAVVVFVFLEPPQNHLIVPAIEVAVMDGSKFTIDEIFQHFGARTNPARDRCYKRRKRIVQAEWGTGVLESWEAIGFR